MLVLKINFPLHDKQWLFLKKRRCHNCPTKGISKKGDIALKGITTKGIATKGIATKGIDYKGYRFVIALEISNISNYFCFRYW